MLDNQTLRFMRVLGVEKLQSIVHCQSFVQVVRKAVWKPIDALFPCSSLCLETAATMNFKLLVRALEVRHGK